MRVEEGTVYFKDIGAFSNVMSHLHTQGVAALDDFLQQTEFSNSLRSARSTQTGDISSNTTNIAPDITGINIRDEFLATVVNQRGIFYIGDTIHKISTEYEYAQVGGDEESLNQLITNSEISASSDLIAHRIRSQSFLLPNFSGNEAYFVDIGTDWAGNPKRVRLEAWSQTYLAYASNGVKLATESYRKTCWLCSKAWRDSAVPYLKVTVQSRQRYLIGGTYTPWLDLNGEEEVYDYDKISKTMGYAVGPGVWVETDYIDCTYTVIPEDSLRRDMFVHWD